MVRRIEELENKIQENAVEILKSARGIEMQLALYEERYNAIPNIKQLIFKLRETANLIAEEVLDSGRNMPLTQTSNMMPCQMCNDHYQVPSEHIRGIRWEPVAGKGYVYICWECSVALYKTLSGQMERLSYSFLFSLDKETETQRNKLLKEIEEAK